MNLKTGFILSYIRYGDNDAILHCFTKENGYESFFVKGLYNPKNKKKAYLSPLNELQFQISSYKKGSLDNVQKIELLSGDLEPNMKVNSILFFVADFLNQILKNENTSQDYYPKISDFLDQIREKNYQSHFALLFIFIKTLGFSPLISDATFLNPLTGCFTNELAHQLFDKEISQLWKEFSQNDKEYSIKIPQHLKNKTLESLLFFYKIHLPNFSKPYSLEVLQQIFH